MSKYHNTPLNGRERNYQINLNKKLCREAKEQGWMLDLSLFIWLSYEYSHKFFTPDRIKEIAEKTTYSPSSIRRKLTTLENYGLITKPNEENDYTYVLASNRQIWRNFDTTIEAENYIPYEVCKLGVRAIYDHLRVMPLIASLERQLRLIAKKEYLISLKTRSQTKGEEVSPKELKRLKKAQDRGFNFDANLILTISNEKIAQLLGVSAPTAIYLKKQLAKLKGYGYGRRYQILLECISYEQYIALRRGEWKIPQLPEHYLWDAESQVIYCETACQYYIPCRSSKKSKFLSQSSIYLDGGRSLDSFQNPYSFSTVSLIREAVREKHIRVLQVV